MGRLGLRGTTLALCALLTAGVVEAAPALAAEATGVAVDPSGGSVGVTVTVTATSGLTHVDGVAFGSGAPAAVTHDADVDHRLTVAVPADATSGALRLTYDDATPDTVTGATFTVVPLATTATIAASRQLVGYPHTVTLTGTLRAAGAGVAGKHARLQRATPKRRDWSTIGHPRTSDATGHVSWTIKPQASRDYRIVFAASPQTRSARTTRTRVRVRPLLGLRVPDVVPVYTRTALTGRVRPQLAGPVLLDERVDGTWRRIRRTTARSDGRFAFHVALDALGRHAFRARRLGDRAHTKATSPVGVAHAVRRSLHAGDSGPDVTALQKRLRTLHYDVGAVSGTYGFDTQHAVVAFEKVQGLARDGVVGTSVWRRLRDPRRPHLLHPTDAATAGVEIDLTRQVLYYAVDGRIRRIFDASTGGGYYYTGSDGSTQKAVTPTGHFAVRYKRDGWVHAPLGELYRPAYFNYDGYAIHGETEVPSYPASHGCVRITVPAMDRFNGKLYVGLSVWIYAT